VTAATIDWAALRAAAQEAMSHAYAPYSKYPVGAAALVDDGRTIVGCNVENASYGLGLCAECGLVSELHASGGGRLVAVSCVDSRGELLMPCGRCRQLLWEHGGAGLLLETADGPRPMAELLPDAFDAVVLRGDHDDPGHPECGCSPQIGPPNVMIAGAAFDAVDLIRTKRDGARLSDEQIDWVIGAYTRRQVPDEQIAALLMAIFLRGMHPAELTRWTAAMISSGVRMDLSTVDRPTVDKHSTGGVGDKITLPLAPVVAACGAAVPQLSGRGLGHTGGTLDKLESIPGWRANVSSDAYLAQLRDVGAVVCAAGDDLAPADKLLYALRDVTGTVESIPLIASSIMSKKIAEGAEALVLDVKVGSGAFMKDAETARVLAETMVGLGDAHGLRTVALLTAMDVPLGRTVGNALEVAEAVEVLSGGGPPDVVELTVTLAREMLAAVGLSTVDPADVLQNGRAMDTWRAMIAAQGGDPDAALPTAPERHVVTATDNGVLTGLDAYAVGVAAWRLGAGRARKEDSVSAVAGVVVLAKPGERIEAGAPLLELHTDDPERIPRALVALDGAAEFDGPGDTLPLIIDRIGA